MMILLWYFLAIQTAAYLASPTFALVSPTQTIATKRKFEKAASDDAVIYVDGEWSNNCAFFAFNFPTPLTVSMSYKISVD